MGSTNPHPITNDEWREIMKIEAVRDAWGLEAETPAEFSRVVYGARFTFQSGGPGYQGDLFILQGDDEAAGPMVLVRASDGHLAVVTS